ncbi:MAG: hypothetical protein NWR59_11160 [Cyanobium sp. MAG_185]|nr:hypothetical protein [Cyanobium sp. MAG_185]
MSDRRKRIHDLVLALLAQQKDLELLAGDGTGLPSGDPGNWIERNRRVVQRYQALVRSAVTLDALVDQEVKAVSRRQRPQPTRSPGAAAVARQSW